MSSGATSASPTGSARSAPRSGSARRNRPRGRSPPSAVGARGLHAPENGKGAELGEGDGLPEPAFDRPVEGEPGGGEVLHSEAKGLEDRDLLAAPAAGRAAGQDGTDLGDDVGLRDRSLPDREEDVARFREGGGASIDVEPRARQGGGVELPPVGAAGADGVDVGSGGEPSPAEDGLPSG